MQPEKNAGKLCATAKRVLTCRKSTLKYSDFFKFLFDKIFFRKVPLFSTWRASVACLFVMILSHGTLFAQSYLGLNGGFEGSATIDNANVQTSAQSGSWTKNNASTTIANETTTVRSGSKSLRIQNSSTTGRRVWAPVMAVSTSSAIVIQYYRRVASTTAQECQEGINRNGTESLSGNYGNGTANTWTKVTYAPTGTTPTANALWGVITTRVPSGGTAGDIFIDDVCVYVASAADTTAPNSPGTPVVNNATTSSLDLSWSAASGGVDSGGYLVVRFTSNPAAADDPNQNGIYAVGNTIPGTVAGTVVFQGTATSFTDSSLTPGQIYYYKVYTYDKAYNYSAETTGNGTTTAAVVAPTLTTPTATSIGTTTATLGATVTADGGASLTSRGTVWGTSASPTGNGQVASGVTVDAFTDARSGFSANTLYTYRGYAVNSVGTGYSPDGTFWTLAATPSAPTVGNPTVSSLDVAIGSGDGNPSATRYAIKEAGGNFVQSGGSLGGTAFYQTATAWGTKTVTGLASSTTYTFSVQATNGAGTLTSLSSGTAGTTATPATGKIVVTLPGQSFASGSGNSGSVSAQTSGTPFNITLTATLADGVTTDAAYTGTHTISYSGPSGSPIYSTSVSFTAGQAAGVATTLKVAETTAITATDGSLDGITSSFLTVNPGAINSYVVAASSPQTAGSTFNVTVTAKDANNNTVFTDSSTSVTMTGTGGVTFDSDGDSTFDDNAKTLSSGTFTISTKDTVAESITITATDGNAKTGTSSSIVINPGAIHHYVVSASSPQVVGVAFNAIVTAKDVNNNTVTTDSSTSVTMSGTGSVTFDSDGNGTFGDNVKTLSSGTFTISTKDSTAETITVTATDANSKTGASGNILVALIQYRSKTSGNWNVTATWEQSSDNGATWGDAAATPTSSASTITIRNGHSVTNTASVTIDQMIIANGGTLVMSTAFTINNGTGDDIDVQNGGLWVLNTSTVPTFNSGATAKIETGGVLRIGVTGITGSGATIHSANVIYQSGSILECAVTSISSSGITFFPNVDANTIPIFRQAVTISAGANTATVINGILEVASGATFSWSGTATKTFRNGIRGEGSVDQGSAGQFIISGATAELGGSGAITLGANGLAINSGSFVTLSSDKTISSGTVANAGSLDLGGYNLIMDGLSGSGAVTNSQLINNLTMGNDGGTSSFSGIIGGPLSLTKSGSGTLTLSGNNTYSGNTTNLQGTISIGGSVATPFGSGTFYWAGGKLALTGDRSSAAAILNPINMIASTELFAATTSGTRNLIFGGAITGTAGTLTIHNTQATVGPATFAVRFTNTFSFSRPITFAVDTFGNFAELDIYNRIDLGDQTYGGVISGPGIVKRTVNSAGTGGKVTFTQQNTYSLGTSLNDGEIGLGSDCTGSANAPTAGPLGTGTLTINNEQGRLSASGASRNLYNPVVFASGQARLGFLGANDLELSGNVNLGAQTVTFTNSNTGVCKLSGILSNGSLTKQGLGTLTLSGANTYSGTTTISNGTLLVNGSLGGSGAVIVITNAILGGTGGINGAVTVQAGGTLAPGASIGTLTLTNVPTFSGTNLMEIDRGGSPTADKIVLTSGTLTYGGVLTVNNIGTALQGGEVFDLFDAGLLTGSFSVMNLPALGTGTNWYTGKLTVDGTIKVNRAPTAIATTSNCTPSLSTVIQITGAGGLAGDADGDTLTTTVSTAPIAGTNIVFTAGGNTYIYYKNINTEASSDSFVYKVTDGFGGTNTATITIALAVPSGNIQGTLSAPQAIEGGPGIRLKFLGYPGYKYALEWTNSLGGTDPWIPLSTNPANGTGLLIFTNSTPDQSQNYYRTRWVP